MQMGEVLVQMQIQTSQSKQCKTLDPNVVHTGDLRSLLAHKRTPPGHLRGAMRLSHVYLWGSLGLRDPLGA